MIGHCCIKRLRDHEAVNLPADVHSAAVTRARKGPDRVSGCHGAGADERFSCRMIMRSLNATVPCGDRLPTERSPVTGQVVDPFQDVADLCQIVRYAYWRASGHRAGGNGLGGWQGRWSAPT